ncbi:MAG: hypothetical protein EOO47_26920 [Flavobacterium sp.]|nr:MAG: hypothetical protein EOO47_26920 [Flavobacterium sp.]
MKKILTLLIILVTISCKKDPSEEELNKIVYNESQILGRWVYESVKLNGILSPYNHRCKTKDAFYFRNRPGRHHQYDENLFNANCSATSATTTWRMDGDNLILRGPKDSYYKIIRLNETNFDVSVTVDFDGDGKLDKVEIYAVKGNCEKNDPNCEY